MTAAIPTPLAPDAGPPDLGLAEAAALIAAYTFGMDTADWDRAAAPFADPFDVDYAAVGGPAGRLTRAKLRAFLAGLLGKPDLRVHTALGQVLRDARGGPQPQGDGFVAYYTVRHFRGAPGQARQFALYGWYRFRIEGGRIAALAIDVTATEGDPAVLA